MWINWLLCKYLWIKRERLKENNEEKKEIGQRERERERERERKSKSIKEKMREIEAIIVGIKESEEEAR